jgi:Ca2+-binding EF-hand superfamily protein
MTIPMKTEKLLMKLKYDRNKDGFLDESELTTMLKIIDPNLAANDVTWIFLSFDVNRDGYVSCTEFINSIENLVFTESFL